MIDIKEKMQPQRLFIGPWLYDRVKELGVDMTPFARVEMIPPPIDLRQRPDGVWDLPK